MQPKMYRKVGFGWIFFLWLAACHQPQEEVDIARAQAELGEERSGGNLTSSDLSENAFGKEANGLSFEEERLFVTGNSLFQSNWVTAPSSVASLDGLGPLFNQSSCGGCHFKDGRARPPSSPNAKLNGLLFRLSIPGVGIHGEPLPEPAYGRQLQDKAILDAVPEAQVQVSYDQLTGSYADGTVYSLQKPVYQFSGFAFGDPHLGLLVSPRIAQQIPGLGLLEAVSEQTIRALADENDRNADGISGKANEVWDEESQRVTLGRFGWKANEPSLRQQTAGALNGDMGLTTTLFAADALTPVQKARYDNLPNGGQPEISEEQLRKIVFYVQTLAVPIRRHWQDAEVLRGKWLFAQLNCTGCHIPAMQTGTTHPIQILHNQTIRPYTDLLLHDMGDALADHRPDFLANGREWRTPPLWGIGLVKTVNKHTFFLHDGRATNLEEAILWHGGEAHQSQEGFKKLSKTDRTALIRFLESL